MTKILSREFKGFFLLFLIATIIISCTSEDIGYDLELGHAQGEMAGEVTRSSVILQSRLTQGASYIRGDIQGSSGIACFEIAEERDFKKAIRTKWLDAVPEYDFIIKQKVTGLKPGTQYFYRLLFAPELSRIKIGETCTFRTHDNPEEERDCSFVVVTGMHFHYFHYGVAELKETTVREEEREADTPSFESLYGISGKKRLAWENSEMSLGYPSLKTILHMKPDFFVGTGDNVYYDEPLATAAQTQEELRKKFHEQFSQPRYIDLFAQVPTYWEKDDHDYRFNDADPYTDTDRLTSPYRTPKSGWGPSHELGIATFNEQLPVVDPKDTEPVTYRTHQINGLLQIWLVEGRDYRSSNSMPDGPDKTIWGEEQKAWLKRTLQESRAVFKILISPTPMVGPDDAYKSDNHTNATGFRYEADEFFSWLRENNFLEKNFYIICGDRHWQYHAIHPSGIEEFSCGALVDANSRLGREAGDPDSTDPEAKIVQSYLQKEASGGFLRVRVVPPQDKKPSQIQFSFYDEHGILLYECIKIKNKNVLH